MRKINLNFEMPEDIHKIAKSKSALMGITLQNYIIEAIKEKNAKQI